MARRERQHLPIHPRWRKGPHSRGRTFNCRGFEIWYLSPQTFPPTLCILGRNNQNEWRMSSQGLDLGKQGPPNTSARPTLRLWKDILRGMPLRRATSLATGSLDGTILKSLLLLLVNSTVGMAMVTPRSARVNGGRECRRRSGETMLWLGGILLTKTKNYNKIYLPAPLQF